PCTTVTFSLYYSVDPRDPPSFPTRRSSDLRADPRTAGGSDQDARRRGDRGERREGRAPNAIVRDRPDPGDRVRARPAARGRDHPDRKSTRLNSSHRTISYAVFCLKKKTIES